MRRSLALTILFMMACISLSYAEVLKQYFPDGKVYTMRTYKNGRQDGPYRIYWPNGRLREKGKYKQGYPYGPVRQYSNTGVLIQK